MSETNDSSGLVTFWKRRLYAALLVQLVLQLCLMGIGLSFTDEVEDLNQVYGFNVAKYKWHTVMEQVLYIFLSVTIIAGCYAESPWTLFVNALFKLALFAFQLTKIMFELEEDTFIFSEVEYGTGFGCNGDDYYFNPFAEGQQACGSMLTFRVFVLIGYVFVIGILLRLGVAIRHAVEDFVPPSNINYFEKPKLILYIVLLFQLILLIALMGTGLSVADEVEEPFFYSSNGFNAILSFDNTYYKFHNVIEQVLYFAVTIFGLFGGIYQDSSIVLFFTAFFMFVLMCHQLARLIVQLQTTPIFTINGLEFGTGFGCKLGDDVTVYNNPFESDSLCNALVALRVLIIPTYLAIVGLLTWVGFKIRSGAKNGENVANIVTEVDNDNDIMSAKYVED